MDQKNTSQSTAATNVSGEEVEIDQLREAAEKASELLKNLANNHRLMVLCMLAEGEMSVAQLGEHIDLGQSPLSQHLARLRSDGLVKTRKVAQHVYYSLDSEEAGEVIQTLHRLYCKS